MSVLACPVCQGSMKEINKSGVMIDTCTQCRGVWLDRGELEKLAAVVGTEHRSFLGSAFPPQTDRGRRRDDDDDDDRRYGHDQPRQRRRSFLDFFD